MTNSPKLKRSIGFGLSCLIAGFLFVAAMVASSVAEAQCYGRGISQGSRGGGGGGGGGRGVGGAAVGIGIGIGTAVILNEAAKARERNKKKKRTVKPKRKKTKKKATAKKPVKKKTTKKKTTKKKPTKQAKKPTRKAPAAAVPVPDFIAGEVLLVFAPDTNDAGVNQFLQEYGLTLVNSATIALIDQRIIRARLPDNIPPERTLQISNDPRVTLQPNYLYAVSADEKIQYAVAKLGVPEAHRTYRGEGILVAVIDSGIDAKHPALKGAVLEEFEAVEAPKGAADTHGTTVASIIAAREGMTSVAPQAMLLSVKAFAPDKKYGRTLGNTYDLLRGIDWAVQKHAKVLNLSFAGPRDPLLQSALDAASKKGIVMVGAAGNKGPDAPPAYPGAYEEVIAATATDAKDRLYKQANRGDYVAIAAPGVDILAAGRKQGYSVTSGTSLAAAYVSGSVALIMQDSPDMTTQDALDRMAGTAKDLGDDGKDPSFGHGLLDVYQAVGGGSGQMAGTQASPDGPAN